VALACIAALACSGSDRHTSVAPVPGPRPLAPPGLRLPDGAVPLAYDVRLDIDPASEIFAGEVTIEVRLDRPADHVWLHVAQLSVMSAQWSTKTAHGALEVSDLAGEQMRAFRFGRVLAAGTVTLKLAYTGWAGGDQEGLFRQRDGAWYVFSQGEAVFARRILPCFDEPRFKTPWRVTLIVPRPLVALSNMPEESTRVVPGNKKEVVFARTAHDMPSYLLAVAVGPFELVDAGTVGRHSVPVRVAVRAGQGKRAGIVAERLGAVVEAMERYLDEPLPLTKLDLVGVPRFFGAMENPGLITFHETILLGDPRREAFANYFTYIAAHELAHQWFGNALTPAWWDHLWLSEAMASWFGDKVVRQLRAYDDVPLRGALARREAIEADRTGAAKPLWRHVKTTEEADEGFDSIAYAKGQLVLGTFESFVGEEAFQARIRGYVRKHLGGVVASADLVAAIGGSLAPAFARYANKPGTPLVELTLRCSGDGSGGKAVLEARAVDSVPLCVRHGTGKAAQRRCKLVSGADELELGSGCPPWIHGNPDAAYYHTRWIGPAPRGPSPRLLDLDPASRVVAGDDLAAAIHRGELSAATVLAELRAFTDSRDPYAQLGAAAIARAFDGVVDDAARPAWATWLAARFAERLAPDKKPLPAETEVTQALMTFVPPERFATAITRRSYDVLDRVLPDATGELPATLVALAAVHGGDRLFDRIASRARLLRDPEVRASWLATLGEFPAAQLPRALDLVVKGDLDPAVVWPAVVRYLARGTTRTAAWRLVKRRLDVIVRRMGTEAADVIDATATLCDASLRGEVADAFAPHVATITNGPERLARTLQAIDACIARRSVLGDVGAALAAAR
jgi:cytosol alanyl aminopeptidase